MNILLDVDSMPKEGTMNIYLGIMQPLGEVVVIQDHPTPGSVYIKFQQKDGNFFCVRVTEEDFLNIVQPQFKKDLT